MDESNINTPTGDGMNMPPSQRPPMSSDEAAMFANKSDPPVSSASTAAPLSTPLTSPIPAEPAPKTMLPNETLLPHNEVQKPEIEMPMATKISEIPASQSTSIPQSMLSTAHGKRIWVKVVVVLLILAGVFLLYEYMVYRTLIRSAASQNTAQ